jgi:hypothetical protein
LLRPRRYREAHERNGDQALAPRLRGNASAGGCIGDRPVPGETDPEPPAKDAAPPLLD